MTRPMTYTMVVIVAVIAIVTPLIPEPFRQLNFALFGALGLFASARVGFWPGLAICLGSKVVSDFANYFAQHQNEWYSPKPEFILCFAIYPILGRLLRRTDHPMAVAGCAVTGTVLFFLASNFASWCNPKSLYGYLNNNLLTCYVKGLEFLRGRELAPMSDMIFAVSVFAIHSILAEHYFPVEKAVRLPVVDNGGRS